MTWYLSCVGRGKTARGSLRETPLRPSRRDNAEVARIQAVASIVPSIVLSVCWIFDPILGPSFYRSFFPFLFFPLEWPSTLVPDTGAISTRAITQIALQKNMDIDVPSLCRTFHIETSGRTLRRRRKKIFNYGLTRRVHTVRTRKIMWSPQRSV